MIHKDLCPQGPDSVAGKKYKQKLHPSELGIIRGDQKKMVAINTKKRMSDRLCWRVGEVFWEVIFLNWDLLQVEKGVETLTIMCMFIELPVAL